MYGVLCLLFPLAITSVLAQSCTSISDTPGCTCRLDGSQQVIDLSSIGNKDGTARFELITTPSSGICDYNPCYSFTSDYNREICKDVAGCVFTTSGEVYSLGTQESAYFTTNSGHVAIHYSGGTGGRGMLVTLICNPDATTPEITGQDAQDNIYHFQLVTKCACGDGCTKDSSDDDGGGDSVGIVGIILILLLIFGFALYFGIGAAWRTTKHDAKGWDVIPHKEFWQDLPYLIKDGFMFTIQPITYAVKRCKGETEESSPIVDKDTSTSNYGT